MQQSHCDCDVYDRLRKEESYPSIGMFRNLPIVSIVVPFWGYFFRILNIKLGRT